MIHVLRNTYTNHLYISGEGNSYSGIHGRVDQLHDIVRQAGLSWFGHHLLQDEGVEN